MYIIRCVVLHMCSFRLRHRLERIEAIFEFVLELEVVSFAVEMLHPRRDAHLLEERSHLCAWS